jgi:CRISPR system Cascade subunit CasE
MYLYLVSPSRPDLTHLDEQIGRPTLNGWETKDYAPFLKKLDAGQVWAFRLTANPVHDGRKKPGAETQRYGHLTSEQQREWLISRMPRWGVQAVEIPEGGGDTAEARVDVVGRENLRFAHRRAGTNAGTIVLNRVSYEGLLRIDDADVLRAYLTSGMGHAKAYGCGLMTLAQP